MRDTTNKAVNMKRILVFVVMTILKPAWFSYIGISERNSTWNKASSHNLLSMKYLKKYGWNSLNKHLQVNESYWIGARGNYTDIVSWEGCTEYQEGFSSNPNCQLTKYEDSGSVSKCLNNCKSPYFALKESVCFCLSEEQRKYCLKESSKECGNQCLENPNDFCGTHTNVMALYSKDKPDELNNMKANDSEGSCVVLYSKHERASFKRGDCYSFGRRYICKGSNGTHPEDHGSLITWQQAFDACRQKGERLYYTKSYTEEFGNSTYFWTSLRRSFNLIWTTSTGGSTKCAAVSKTETTILVVTLENCTKELRRIYVIDNIDEDSLKKKERPTSNTMLITLLVIACIALSAIVGGVCFFRHRSKRKPNIKPVNSVVNKPQRQTETTSRPANPPYYNIVEPGPGREAQADTSAQSQTTGSDVPARPPYMYHTFADVAQDENSFYNSTSTSQNWNSRKQTRDGTIYGIRSVDNSYDSASCGNSNKKKMAPVCPNYDEVAKF